MRKWIITIIVIVVAAAALGFTKPGHRVLNSLGTLQRSATAAVAIDARIEPAGDVRVRTHYLTRA